MLSRNKAKSFFKTGSKPTENVYAELWDSLLFLNGDNDMSMLFDNTQEDTNLGATTKVIIQNSDGFTRKVTMGLLMDLASSGNAGKIPSLNFDPGIPKSVIAYTIDPLLPVTNGVQTYTNFKDEDGNSIAVTEDQNGTMYWNTGGYWDFVPMVLPDNLLKSNNIDNVGGVASYNSVQKMNNLQTQYSDDISDNWTSTAGLTINTAWLSFGQIKKVKNSVACNKIALRFALLSGISTTNIAWLRIYKSSSKLYSTTGMTLLYDKKYTSISDADFNSGTNTLTVSLSSTIVLNKYEYLYAFMYVPNHATANVAQIGTDGSDTNGYGKMYATQNTSLDADGFPNTFSDAPAAYYSLGMKLYNDVNQDLLVNTVKNNQISLASAQANIQTINQTLPSLISDDDLNGYLEVPNISESPLVGTKYSDAVYNNVGIWRTTTNQISFNTIKTGIGVDPSITTRDYPVILRFYKAPANDFDFTTKTLLKEIVIATTDVISNYDSGVFTYDLGKVVTVEAGMIVQIFASTQSKAKLACLQYKSTANADSGTFYINNAASSTFPTTGWTKGTNSFNCMGINFYNNNTLNNKFNDVEVVANKALANSLKSNLNEFGTGDLGFIDYQDLDDSADYNQIIMYGQSLSMGWQSPEAISYPNIVGNFMIGDKVAINHGNNLQNVLNPLVSTVATNCGENPTVGMVNHFSQLWRRIKNKSSLFIATSCGEGGKSIEQLSKECTNNSNNSTANNLYTTEFLSVLNRTKATMTALNKKTKCFAITYMQGEYNYTLLTGAGLAAGTDATTDKATYKAFLLTLKNNMQADIMTAYGQTKKPLFFVYQVSGNYINNRTLSINIAQQEFADENDDVILMNPHYQCPHYAYGHLSTNGYRWYGEMMGKSLYNAFVKLKDFSPVRFKSLSITNNVIKIDLYVPVLPLVLDTWTQTKMTNFGFQVWQNNTAVSITDLSISNNSILITCSSNLVGTVEVNYAGSGVNGTGNLRDSDNYNSMYTYYDDSATTSQVEGYTPRDKAGNKIYGKKYPMQNWLLPFYASLVIASS